MKWPFWFALWVTKWLLYYANESSLDFFKLQTKHTRTQTDKVYSLVLFNEGGNKYGATMNSVHT